MLQKARVTRIIDSEIAEIAVIRASACGHDCSECSGCGASNACVITEATNKIGAKVGDNVNIQINTTAAIGIAAVVYMLPLVLFFACYVLLKLASFDDAVAIVGGFVGFSFGVINAILKNKKVSNTDVLDVEIISLSDDL